MAIKVVKTTAPIVTPTITPMGIVVEDEGEEELLEEAAGRGVVILTPMSFTQKRNAASPTTVELRTVAVDIVRFIWSAIYPIVGSEPRTTDVEPL
jgi:hypothetical protein